MQIERVERATFTQRVFQDREVRARAPKAVEGQHRQRAMTVGAVGEGGAVGEVLYQRR